MTLRGLRFALGLRWRWNPLTAPAHNGAPGWAAPLAHLVGGLLFSVGSWDFPVHRAAAAAIGGAFGWLVTRLIWIDWHDTTGRYLHGSELETSIVAGSPYTVDAGHWLACLLLTETAAVGQHLVRTPFAGAVALLVAYVGAALLPQEG